tara:strand:+ start:2153 stop:2893 length:741 start_codon:yes stop_codon:yes gene_type:complete
MNDTLISATSEETDTEEVQTTAPVSESTQSDRPEWLPEKYKSPEDLAKAYKELESKFGTKEEDLRKKLVQELESEAFKDRPATSGDYQLPDYVDPEQTLDNSMLKWWADHAYENGYSQAEFEKGIEMYHESTQGSGSDLEGETKKLGENANTRIQAASMFANKFFPKDALPAIERMCETHEGIIALESIMEAMKDGSFTGKTEPANAMNEQALREMMQDERYWRSGKQDNHFIKQVGDGFKKLYGN